MVKLIPVIYIDPLDGREVSSYNKVNKLISLGHESLKRLDKGYAVYRETDRRQYYIPIYQFFKSDLNFENQAVKDWYDFLIKNYSGEDIRMILLEDTEKDAFVKKLKEVINQAIEIDKKDHPDDNEYEVYVEFYSSPNKRSVDISRSSSAYLESLIYYTIKTYFDKIENFKNEKNELEHALLVSGIKEDIENG